MAADPSALVSSATCFDTCIPPGMQLGVQTYLLAVLAGVDTSNPSALVNDARCFGQCIPPGDQLAVQNYLLSLLVSA